jgi:uncharacterized membrane protein HdeD (DUF308 family)
MKTGLSNRWFYVYAIASVVFGLSFVIWPATSQRVILYIVGACSFILGVAQIIGHLGREALGLKFQINLLHGLVAAVIGLLVLLKVDDVISIIASLVGLILLIISLIKVKTSLALKASGYQNWKAAAIVSAVSAFISFLFLLNPFSSMAVVSVCLGIFLILNGLLDLWTLTFLSKQLDRQNITVNIL